MLHSTTQELVDKLDGLFILRFDDGDMEVDAHSTILSHMVWEYHRRYERTPLLKKHHAVSHSKEGVLTNKTIINCVNDAAWSAYDVYREEWNNDSNLIAKRAYEIQNTIFNFFSSELYAWVGSLDILDFMEIDNHPEVKPVLDKEERTQEFINEAYDKLKWATCQSTDLMFNPIARGIRAGLIKEGQMNQCLGPRGKVTDVDSSYLGDIIARGFYRGLREFSDVFTESRSAAQSMYLSQDLLRDAEYFARKLQLKVQVIETIHPGDCGSQSTLNWRIRDEEYDDNNILVRRSDLEVLNGKYYISDCNNGLRMISPKDKHLIGQSVRLRSPFGGCRHTDPNGICEACFGALYESIPDNTNAGHHCSTEMTSQSGQNILSTKHLNSSKTQEKLRIQKDHTDYFVASRDDNYILHPQVANWKPKLQFNIKQAPGLVDLADNDVETLSLDQISNINKVWLRFSPKGDREFIASLSVQVNNQTCNFSYPFLEFIKGGNLEHVSGDNYMIDLEGWDFKQEILILSKKQFNMADHNKAIQNYLDLSKDRLKLRKNVNPIAMIRDFSDLVNSKLSVNFAHLEVILLSYLAQDEYAYNSFIPKDGTEKHPCQDSVLIMSRSVSPAFGYDDVVRSINDPTMFVDKLRPHLSTDVLLTPHEVVNDKYRYTMYYNEKSPNFKY